MKAILKKDRWRDEVNLHGMMEGYIKEISKMD
jgi:hypothetical protein